MLELCCRLGRASALVAGLLLLSGCGGGGDNTAPTPITEVPYAERVLPVVEGEFKSGAETGVAFPADPAFVGDSAYCQATDRYFETELVRVYADEGIDQNDILKVATWAHYGASAVTEYFGMTAGDLIQWHPFTPSTYHLASSYLLDHYSYNAEGRAVLSQFSDIELSTDPAMLTSDTERMRLFYRQLLQMEDTRVEAIAMQMRAEGFPTHVGEKTPNRLIVCFNHNLNNNYWGTASRAGFSINPRTLRDPDGILAAHELVHTYHELLLNGWNVSPIDFWFQEGIAEYVAGVAGLSMEQHNGYDPLNDKGFTTPSVFRYAHYAIAVSYLEQTSPGFIGNVLNHIDEHGLYRHVRFTYGGAEETQYDYDPTWQTNPDFRTAFNRYAKRPDGSPLTYEAFEAEYHDLIDEWLVISMVQ